MLNFLREFPLLKDFLKPLGEFLELLLMIYSLAFLICPGAFGLNLFTLSLPLGFAAYYAMKLFNEHGNATDNQSSIFSFMWRTTYYPGHMPWFLGLCSLMCLISTDAPLKILLAGMFQSTLSGNSRIDFLLACGWQITYACGMTILTAITKLLSKNSGTQQAAVVQLFFKKRLEETETGLTEDSKRELDEKGKGNFRDANKLVGQFWYFTQTVMQSMINMITSLIAVMSFSTPPQLQTAKHLLMIRTIATSIFINLLSYQFGDRLVSKRKASANDTRNHLYAKGYQEEETTKNIEKNTSAQLDTNLLGQIQDSIYNLPKNMLKRDALALLLVVMVMDVPFPLNNNIKLITGLAAALSNMLVDFLTIARNQSAWTDATAMHEAVTKKITVTNNNNSQDTLPTLEENKIKEYAEGIPQNPRNSSGNQDLVDICVTLSCGMIIADWGLRWGGIEKNLLTALIASKTSIAITAPLAGIAASALTGYWLYAYHKASTPNAGNNNIPGLQIAERFGNIFCNLCATGLWARMVCMFSEYSIPAAIIELTTFGLSTQFVPQMAITTITTALVTTLFLTPLLRPEHEHRFSTPAHLAWNTPSYLRTLLETCVKAIMSPRETMNTIRNAVGSSLVFAGNKVAQLSYAIKDAVVPTLVFAGRKAVQYSDAIGSALGSSLAFAGSKVVQLGHVIGAVLQYIASPAVWISEIVSRHATSVSKYYAPVSANNIGIDSRQNSESSDKSESFLVKALGQVARSAASMLPNISAWYFS